MDKNENKNIGRFSSYLDATARIGNFFQKNDPSNFTSKNFNYSTCIRSECMGAVFGDYAPGDWNAYTYRLAQRRKRYKGNKAKSHEHFNRVAQILNNQEVVLISHRFFMYNEVIEGKQYNRILDPILEEYRKLDYRVCKLHYMDKIAKNPYHTGYQFEFRQLVEIFSNEKNDGLVEPISQEVEEQISKINLPVNKAAVAWQVEIIEWLSKELKSILKNSSIKLIIASENLHVFNQALFLATRFTGITSVEMAHGSQSKQDIGYSTWAKQEISNLISPDFFWTWDDFVQKRFTAHRYDHAQVINGGIPYAIKWSEKEYDKLFISQLRDLNLLASGFSKTILLCTQPVNNCFPLFLGEYIKKSKDILFIHRPHPMEENSDFYKKQKQLYLSPLSDLQNFITFNNGDYPIHLLLGISSYMITPFSTVASESIPHNCNAIFSHVDSLLYFKEFIDENIFFTAFTYDRLKEIIDCNLKNKKLSIQTRKSLQSNLKSLIQ